MSKKTLYLFSSGIAILSIICFFIPFYTMKSAHNELLNLSVFQMMFINYEAYKFNISQIFALLFFIGAILRLILALLDKFEHMQIALTGLDVFSYLFLIYFLMNPSYSVGVGTSSYRFEKVLFGCILLGIMLLADLVITYYQFYKNNKSKETLCSALLSLFMLSLFLLPNYLINNLYCKNNSNAYIMKTLREYVEWNSSDKIAMLYVVLLFLYILGITFSIGSLFYNSSIKKAIIYKAIPAFALVLSFTFFYVLPFISQDILVKNDEWRRMYLIIDTGDYSIYFNYMILIMLLLASILLTISILLTVFKDKLFHAK